ncbi:MAG: AI-2E family transporter [Planctomycetota bacterium]|nr:AI-2E family transporter [Planctomycetota bacterium]
MRNSNRTVLILLSILATILVGWVLHVGAAILQPLVIAFLLASMLQPVVVRLARWHIPPALTVIALVAVLFVGLAQAGILLQENISQFLGQAREDGAQVTAPIDPSAEVRPEDSLDWPLVVAGLEERMQNSSMPDAARSLIASSLNDLDLEGLARGVLGSGLGFSRALTLVMIYMIFIFAEQKVFRRKILSIAGPRENEARRVLDTIGRGIQKYLGVKTAVSLMTGSLCYLVMTMLGVPFALLFGLLTFMLNYIPTFGSIIAGIFPTVTMLAFEGSWEKALIVAGAYLAVNLTLGSFLEPKILGRELNLSPLVIIVSVVVWAGIWGVVGAFLAVPLTSAIQIVLLASERTKPVAVLLSIGPPAERKAPD